MSAARPTWGARAATNSTILASQPIPSQPSKPTINTTSTNKPVAKVAAAAKQPPKPPADPATDPSVPLPPLLLIDAVYQVDLHAPVKSGKIATLTSLSSLQHQDERPFVMIHVPLAPFADPSSLAVKLSRVPNTNISKTPFLSPQQSLQTLSLELNTGVFSFKDDVQYREYRKVSKQAHKPQSTIPTIPADCRPLQTGITIHVKDILTVCLPPMGTSYADNNDRSIIYRGKHILKIDLTQVLNSIHEKKAQIIAESAILPDSETLFSNLTFTDQVSAHWFPQHHILSLKCFLTTSDLPQVTHNTVIPSKQPTTVQKSENVQQNQSIRSPLPTTSSIPPTETPNTTTPPPPTVHPSPIQQPQPIPSPTNTSTPSLTSADKPITPPIATVSAQPVTAVVSQPVKAQAAPVLTPKIQQKDQKPEQNISKQNIPKQLQKNEKHLAKHPKKVQNSENAPILHEKNDEDVLIVPQSPPISSTLEASKNKNNRNQRNPSKQVKTVTQPPTALQSPEQPIKPQNNKFHGKKTEQSQKIQEIPESFPEDEPLIFPDPEPESSPEPPTPVNENHKESNVLEVLQTLTDEDVLKMSGAVRRKLMKDYRRVMKAKGAAPLTIAQLFPSVAQQLLDQQMQQFEEDTPVDDAKVEQDVEEKKKQKHYEELKLEFNEIFADDELYHETITNTFKNVEMGVSGEAQLLLKQKQANSTITQAKGKNIQKQQNSPILKIEPTYKIVHNAVEPIYRACTICSLENKTTCNHCPIFDEYSPLFDASLVKTYKNKHIVPADAIMQHAVNTHQLNQAQINQNGGFAQKSSRKLSSKGSGRGGNASNFTITPATPSVVSFAPTILYRKFDASNFAIVTKAQNHPERCVDHDDPEFNSNSSNAPRSHYAVYNHVVAENKAKNIITDDASLEHRVVTIMLQEKRAFEEAHRHENNMSSTEGNNSSHNSASTTSLPQLEKVKVKVQKNIPAHFYIQDENGNIRVVFEFKKVNTDETKVIFDLENPRKITGLIHANGNRLPLIAIAPFPLNITKCTYSASAKNATVQLYLVKDDTTQHWSSCLSAIEFMFVQE